MSAIAVVFTEQFYYPDGWGGAQLPRDLTTHLARIGCDVVVICGSDEYVMSADADQGEDPRLSGVALRKTPRVLGGAIHRRKLLKQVVFYVCCAPILVFRRPPTVFVTQTNPPLLVPMVAIAALIHRRPFIVIAQDIYPEVLFAHGMFRSDAIAGSILSRLFAWAYRRATAVVALGEVMAQRIAAKGVLEDRIAIISNWATGSEAIDRSGAQSLRAEWNLTDHFVLLYSGNIGIAHDVETPIAMLRVLLQRHANVRLVFVGNGSRLEEAQRAAAVSGVSHAVQFHPPVPSSDLPRTLGIAQLALVTLRPGFEGLVVPSKMLGYMARVLPTIYVGPRSDAELVLMESGGGKCFRNGAVDQMASSIEYLIGYPNELEVMGKSATRYYEARSSRAEGLRKYERLISAVASGSVTPESMSRDGS